MFIMRPVKNKDLDQMFALSSQVRSGLTTLPHSRDLLQKSIELSVNSFNQKPEKPDREHYLFVLEDLDVGRVVGSSAVVAKVGGFEPFYTYKIKTVEKKCEKLNVNKEIQYLQLVKNHSGPTEIGTLFLLPDYRSKGVGRLLSLSRFLFMAEYPECFEEDVIAELRGVFDENERSPFWEALGHHFFEVDFKKADLMVMEDKSFIEELIPQHPIYIPLLTKEAQAVIGQVHENTKPALHMLEKEGFRFKDEIDIFEAGPVISAKRNDVRTIRESQSAIVVRTVNTNLSGPAYLIANVQSFEQFCIGVGSIQAVSSSEIEITQEVAATLNLKEGDKVRYVLAKPES